MLSLCAAGRTLQNFVVGGAWAADAANVFLFVSGSPFVQQWQLMCWVSALQGAPTQPLQLDEKHKKFYQIFDHVTDVQASEYGGQAFAPNKDVEFEALPDKPHEHPLPEVSKAPERDFLKEDMEARQRTAQAEQKHSERYDKAHDAFVKTFG